MPGESEEVCEEGWTLSGSSKIMLTAEGGRRSLRLGKFKGGSSILTRLARLKRGNFQYACLLGGASEEALVVKNPPANTGNVRDMRWIPRLGRFPGEGNGNLLQYSCLENPMHRGIWWATVHRVRKNRT